ncbi:hypothetical protein KR222_006909 [Zaprionus bogoriensis]|nr:hypothetical protein KR222_006909 [Zaprionus bogoriensis]
MFSVPTVASTTTPKTTTTTGSASRARAVVYHRIERSFNVMQVSPVVAFMCVQHSQQQIPMLNNFMCMRMRGWHNINHRYNNYLSVNGTTPTKTVLKRTKGLRKKRVTIIRGDIRCRCFRF